MDVAEWKTPSLPSVPNARPRHRFLPPALIGALGTLLLHALLIQSVAFGSRGLKPKPPETQQSALSLPKPTDADGLVLITLPVTERAIEAKNQSAITSLPDLGKTKIKSTISADPPEFLSFETLALNEDVATGPIAPGMDAAEQARLFGIYTGQIQARIDRVWRRPRTPVNEDRSSTDFAETFRCEAQIVQDIKGNVREILMPRCNGSSAWQHSLVVAIQQASPLPMPPSPKVFTSSIALQFVGLPYVAGDSGDEYEPQGRDDVAVKAIGPRSQ